MTNIAFVDCETTHLDAEIGEAWEVAVILREHMDNGHDDIEYVWQIRPDLISFDPEALRIGRFEERFAVPPGAGAAFTAHESGHVTPMTRAEAVTAITNVLSGAVLVGSNPGFDDRHLRRLIGPGSAQWHYRPYDIVQLAAARIGAQAAGPLPWRTHILSRAVGVEPPAEDAAHTALGDARWARAVYDAVMTREKFPLSWEGRAQHAIGLYTATAIELEDTRRALTETRTALRDEHENAQSALSLAEGSIARVHQLLDEPWLAALHGADDHDHVCPDDVRKAVAEALDGPSQPATTDLAAVCTCTRGEPCGCDSMEPGDDQDDDEAATSAKARAAIAPLEKPIRAAKAQERADLREATLRIAAHHLRTTIFAAVYEDAGQRTADGVTRASDELLRLIGEPPSAEPPKHPTLAGALEIVESWFVDVNDGHGLDASDLVHQLQEAGYRLPSDGPS